MGIQLAVDLALAFNGEVINGDAMQLYRGLPIVTNKITSAEQCGIPHHLLGCIELDEEPWRVGQFKKKAEETIEEIRARGKLPVLVGGTHYYTQSLLFKGSSIESGSEGEGEGEGGGKDSTAGGLSRDEINACFPILEGPTEEIYQKLQEVDPAMAERWHPKDRRRIQRSLEIFLTSGKRASDIYAAQKESRAQAENVAIEDSTTDPNTQLSETLLFWVHSDKEVLNTRLDARIGKMLASGLEEEVLSMERYIQDQAAQGTTLDRGRGIWVSIGWKEFADYLSALNTGSATSEELDRLRGLAVEKTQNATRQYARRQVQWIRHKLLPALTQEKVRDRLFLVNSTDVSCWDELVSSPAVQITEAFLQGREMPSPLDISDVAREHLAPKQEGEEGVDEMARKECEICKTVVMGDKQWESHIKSRRHRSVVKNQAKREGQERYLKQQEQEATDT